MSNNLSIDEIIKQAEKIKAENEKNLAKAEQNLQEKAKTAINEVKTDTRSALEKVEQIGPEPEVKEFLSKPKEEQTEQSDKTRTINFGALKKRGNNRTQIFRKVENEVADEFDNETDDDMKIIEDDEEDIFEENLFPVDKTKPVVLSSNEHIKDSSKLQQVPTLIARESLSEYLDGNNKDSDFKEETGIQMSFDGFDDAVETVPTIDEQVAEQILKEQRKEKVNKFRLFGPDKTDEELGDKEYADKDYNNEHQQSGILTGLLNKKASCQIQIVISAILCVIMVLMEVFKDSAYFPNFISSSSAFIGVALALCVITLAVNFNVFLHGLNLKKGINSDFVTSVLSLTILSQTIAFFFNDSLWIDNGRFMGGMMAFALMMSQLGKRQMLVRIIDNFDFIIEQEDKYTIENIANTVDARVIGRGILDEENPIIRTSVKTDFPTNFMEISCKNEPSNRISKVISLLLMGLTILLTVIVGLIDNFNTGINMGICALATSAPISLLYLINTILSDMSAELDKSGSRVCGFEGAEMASGGDALVMEAADLIGKNGCDLHGIKVFNKAKVDDAIIYAAAVIIQTKSPLAPVFDDVIIGKQSILPKVENIVYEDKMGTSAWVYQRKVLVGNRNLLINHGISVPKESFERKFTRKNRRAVYLAVNGKIMAMFVVSYSADPDIKRELRKLERSGITVIVRSNDPYINEESIANYFNLPKGYVRVMNYPASKVFGKYSEMSVEKSPAYIVHNGTARGFISAVRGAEAIKTSKRLVSFLVSFGCALGFAAVSILSIVKGYTQITCVASIAFQSIWGLFIYIALRLKHISF